MLAGQEATRRVAIVSVAKTRWLLMRGGTGQFFQQGFGRVMPTGTTISSEGCIPGVEQAHFPSSRAQARTALGEHQRERNRVSSYSPVSISSVSCSWRVADGTGDQDATEALLQCVAGYDGATGKRVMDRLHVGVGTPEEFFSAGRRIARAADRGEPIPEVHSITFEDLEELLALLTRARIEVFRAAKTEPASISAIAARLHRGEASVECDVDALRDAGLVSVERVPDGDGANREIVRARAARVDFHASIE